MQTRVKLSRAAEILGFSYRTAKRKVAVGEIPTVVSATGRHYVLSSWLEGQTRGIASGGCRCAIYSRESASENKVALASQTDGLRKYATAKGWQIVEVVEEFGSGLNDQRKKLHTLLAKRDFDVLLVEHKDRLTRFGFAWFEATCPFRVEVVNRTEDDTHDLMEDLVAILPGFSGRLHGQRCGRTKTEAAITAHKAEDAAP